jgi:hypothetical protein
MNTMRGHAPARAALALVALVQAEVGIWGLVAPRSFFDDFPGAGHRWVAALGPYNEHLVRDYAAAELGVAVLLLAAAVLFERRLVLVAGTVFFTATLPHFAYHLTTTGSLSTADNLASLGAFVLELVLVAAAMAVGWSDRPTPRPEPETEPHPKELSWHA